MSHYERKSRSASSRKSKIHADDDRKSSRYDIPLVSPRLSSRSSDSDNVDLSNPKKATILINGVEYQLITVEIEKEAEIGMVVGKIDGDDSVFIDEILPHGMIEMHGVLKEGDYLVQAGVYALRRVNIPTALALIERAYDEGRKTFTLVAARSLLTGDTSKPRSKESTNKDPMKPGRDALPNYDRIDENNPPRQRSGRSHKQEVEKKNKF